MNVSGPLLGGATIGGAITLDETEIVVAPLAFAPTDILPITHVNEPAPSRETRRRAGVTDPPEMFHTYVAPGPASGTDATLSGLLAQVEDGAEMTVLGMAEMATTAGAEVAVQPAALATVTV